MNYQELKTLPSIIQQNAALRPEGNAFLFEDAKLTYDQLNRQVNQLGHSLISLGVKKGDRVGIYLFRRIESAPAVFAILSVGAVFVPLDPFAPKEHTKTIVDDCDIKVIITHTQEYNKLKDIIHQHSAHSIKVIGGLQDHADMHTWESVAQNPVGSAFDGEINSEDLAYILYTSGSTGKPKGIMHTHGSGLAFARLSVDLYKIKDSDVIGSFAPLHFDPSLLGYFSGPLAGATTLLIPESHLKFPINLSTYLEERNPTILFAVPKVYMRLVQYGKLETHHFKHLKWVLYSGEPYPTKHLTELMSIWTHATFGNIYGPTELNQCTYYNLSERPAADEPVPIGKAWDETTYQVIDEHDKLLTSGETGELIVHSSTMMKGYWNRPELTEQSFYHLEGKRYYRTGDLVREDNQSELHFLGRKDRQVKVRGYRVELDEIEIVIEKHPQVKEVAVYPVLLEDESLQIEAVVSADKSDTLDIKELNRHIKQYLPPYFLPEKINIVEDLPRNANGKIDYAAIRQDVGQTSGL